MSAIIQAFLRAAASLVRPGVLWHLLWPTLLACVIWIALGVLLWGELAELLLNYVRAWPAVGAWFAEGSALALLTAGAAHFALILAFVPLTFVTATFIIAVFALPMMLDRVAATDYPALQRRAGGSFIGSVTNALLALMLFVALALLSLPLWLVPGLALVIPILLGAWLNQRCYRYDALMAHADAHELEQLPRQHRASLYVLGLCAGVLAFVPFLNFFVPALTGLAFVHYLLAALGEARRTEHIIDVTPPAQSR